MRLNVKGYSWNHKKGLTCNDEVAQEEETVKWLGIEGLADVPTPNPNDSTEDVITFKIIMDKDTKNQFGNNNMVKINVLNCIAQVSGEPMYDDNSVITCLTVWGGEMNSQDMSSMTPEVNQRSIDDADEETKNRWLEEQLKSASPETRKKIIKWARAGFEEDMDNSEEENPENQEDWSQNEEEEEEAEILDKAQPRNSKSEELVRSDKEGKSDGSNSESTEMEDDDEESLPSLVMGKTEIRTKAAEEHDEENDENLQNHKDEEHTHKTNKEEGTKGNITEPEEGMEATNETQMEVNSTSRTEDEGRGNNTDMEVEPSEKGDKGNNKGEETKGKKREQSALEPTEEGPEPIWMKGTFNQLAQLSKNRKQKSGKRRKNKKNREGTTESNKVHPSDFIKKEDRWAGLHVSGWCHVATIAHSIKSSTCTAVSDGSYYPGKSMSSFIVWN